MPFFYTSPACPVLKYLRICLSHVQTLLEPLPMFKFHRLLTRFDLLCLLALLPNNYQPGSYLSALVDSAPDGGVLTAGITSHRSHVSPGHHKPEYLPWS